MKDIWERSSLIIVEPLKVICFLEAILKLHDALSSQLIPIVTYAGTENNLWENLTLINVKEKIYQPISLMLLNKQKNDLARYQ